MFGLLFIRKLSRSALSFLLSYVFPFSLFLRFLIQTVAGTFLVTVAVYWFLSEFGESKPWTFYQLASWLDDLNSEVKTSIFTSILTVVGFLVAFRTGTEGWKVQALGQMKLRLSDELDVFFAEATSLASDLKLIAEGALSTQLLVPGGITNELLFSVGRAAEQSADFQVKRLRLQAMAIQSYRIAGSNFSLLATYPGAVDWVDQAISSLNEITAKVWITLPLGLPDENAQRVHMFYRQVNRPAYEAFIAACEKNLPLINGSVGGVRGILLKAIVTPNWATYFALSRKRTAVVDALDKFNKYQQK